jgi:hypothetical protein
MIDDHNGPQWLVVRYLATGRKTAFWPGWYVVRTCPCHFGQLVTLCFETKDQADHARDAILSVTKANAALGVGG